MHERFISEPLEPDTATFDTSAMAAGGPGLPARFRWRGRWLELAEVLRSSRDTGPCRHGSGERYARKHWFEVRTTDGQVVKLYFERQSRGRGKPRWWLFTIRE